MPRSSLDASSLAVDVVGSVRSGAGALVLAADTTTPTLAVVSDIRTGLPGGTDERDGGDGAAAFLFGGDGPVLAEVLASASTTLEFLDRWRHPGDPASHLWEERFGEHVYVPLADAAFADALKQARLSPGDVDVLVVAGLHGRAAKAFAKGAGVATGAEDLIRSVGNAGTAHAGVALADTLDRAEPGQTIAVVDPGRRGHRTGAAHHRGPRPAALVADGGRAGGRRVRGHALRHLPHLAGVPGS